MPDELIINELENLLSQVVELGAQSERTRMAPNLLVTNPSPTGLANYITVRDDRDGDNILALKVPDIVYNVNDLVNVLFIRGGEAIAFQQGSGSSSSGIWGIISGTSTDIFYNSGDVSIGKAPAPDAKLELVDTTQPQLRLTYTDASVFTDFTVNSSSDLTVQPASTGQVIFRPTTDSTDFFQVLDADGGTPILSIDSTNEKIGIRRDPPAFVFDIGSCTYATEGGIVIRGSSSQTALTSDFSAFAIQNTNNTNNNYVRFDFVDDQGSAGANVTALFKDHTPGSQSADLLFQTRISGTVAERMRVNGQSLFINETSNADMTIGLTINQATNTDHVMAVKNTNVAHGMTDQAETDTYGRWGVVGTSTGGLFIGGFTEDKIGVFVRGHATNDDTTKTTSSNGAINLVGAKKSGTSIGAMGANANILIMSNNGTVRWILDAEGDIFYGSADDGAITDGYDDPMLLSGFRALLSPKDSPAHRRFKGFLRDTENVLVQQGILTAPLNDGGLVSDTGLKGLLIDAIIQLNGKIESLEERINYGLN